MKKRVVIYARFSSHSQTEQSIEGQLRVCYEFAKQNDYAVVGEYIDRALTGTTDKRPQFLKMIDDSKRKGFDFVLVYQLDRFARNRYDSATYKARLKKNGVRVLSAKENITEDASGILIEGVLESMAEYYSAELSQKTKRGVRESLLKGNSIGGLPILGYDVINKKWKVNDRESMIVNDIFIRYKNGEKAKEIIDRLNNQGIKNKQGTKLTMNFLTRLIRNEKYIGRITIDEVVYKNVVPPIIDEKLFYECNEMMDMHKHKPRDCKADKPYILSGKLYCGYCNNAMTAETGTSQTGQVYHYYKCFGRKHDKDSCHKKNIKKDEIENIVFNATVKYILKPNVISEIAKTVTKKFNDEIEKSVVLLSYEKELKSVNSKIRGIMDAIYNGIYGKTTQQDLLTLEAKQEDLEEKIAIEKAKQVQPLYEIDIENFLEYFANKRYKNIEERNEFFNSFINKVVLYDDHLVIFYNTNKRETKHLKVAETIDVLDDLEKEQKENSSEQKFKRVSTGCGEGI